MRSLKLIFLTLNMTVLFALWGSKVDPSLFILGGYFKDYDGNLYPVKINFESSKISIFNDILDDGIKVIDDSVFLWVKGDDEYIETNFPFYKKYYDWYVVKTSLGSLYTLKDDTLIDVVLPVRMFVPALDSALVITGAKPLLNIGDNGEGVVVGIVDRCIDPYIEGLKSGDTTRFLYVKDYLNDTVYSRDEIPFMKDTTGHATALLGIVGLQKDDLVGFAPKSSFIASIGSLWADDVIDGIYWMDSVIEEIEKPFVLLIPLQHYWHIPFKLSPEEEIIDSIFEPQDTGKICVVPAGNIGNKRKVVVNKVFSDDTLLLRWESNYSLYYSTGSFNKGNFCVFIPSSTNSVVRVLFNDNSSYYMTDWLKPDTIPYRIVSNNNDTVFVSYNREWVDDDKKYDYLFLSVNSSQKNYFIGVQIYGDSSEEYIALVPSNGYCRTGVNEELPSYRGYEICVPGNARNVITVGAVTNRLSWIDDYGILRHVDGNVCQIASWSSCGYNGQGKPNISAPGRFIKTLWPSYVNINRSYLSDNYAIVSGTSAASAVVAGICAMVLSVKPNITMKTLYNIITEEPYWRFYMNENMYGKGVVNIYVSLVNYLVNLVEVNIDYLNYHEDTLSMRWQVINGEIVDRWILKDNLEIRGDFNGGKRTYEWKGVVKGTLMLYGLSTMGDTIYEKKIFSKNEKETMEIIPLIRKIKIVPYVSGEILLYDLSGRNIKRIKVNEGEECIFPLKSGIYFVKFDKFIKKVVVK